MLLYITVTELLFFAHLEEQLYGHQTIHGHVYEEISSDRWIWIKKGSLKEDDAENRMPRLS